LSFGLGDPFLLGLMMFMYFSNSESVALSLGVSVSSYHKIEF
jgi:hypothetical protein